MQTPENPPFKDTQLKSRMAGCALFREQVSNARILLFHIINMKRIQPQ